MSLASLSITSCSIERKTTTASASGGQVESFAAVYSDVMVSLQPATGKLMEEFSRRSMVVTHVAYTETPVSLLPGDRLVVSSTKYIVTSFADMGGRGRVYAIYLVFKAD